MSKHTPGPWAWRKFGTGFYLVADYGSRKVVLAATTDRGAPTFAQRDQDGILCELSPKNPDSLLIEAAPDMFEALKEIASSNPSGEGVGDDLVEIARRAVAKAEGRKP